MHNRLQCAKCLDVIESKSVHDFKLCTCQSIFVDGGLDYPRWGGEPENIIDLREYETDCEGYARVKRAQAYYYINKDQLDEEDYNNALVLVTELKRILNVKKFKLGVL